MPRFDEPGESHVVEDLHAIPLQGAHEQDPPALSRPISVVIADGQALMRSGLARLLEEDERLRVVAVSEGGAGLVDLCVSMHVDVLVADVELVDIDILELIHLVSVESPSTRILVLGATASWRVSPVIAAGAGGFLLKDAAPEGLRSAVISVHAGDQVLSRQAALALMNGTAVHQLTPRESTVLHHIARGSTNREIATALHIHETTVRNYVSRLYRKLHSPSRADLASYAMTATPRDPHRLDPSHPGAGLAVQSEEGR